MSPPARLVCPACFTSCDGTHATCSACHEPLWVADRLALLGPIDPDHPRTLRGQLRDGEMVVVKVLDIGGMAGWREHDRFCRQSRLLTLARC